MYSVTGDRVVHNSNLYQHNNTTKNLKNRDKENTSKTKKYNIKPSSTSCQ